MVVVVAAVVVVVVVVMVVVVVDLVVVVVVVVVGPARTLASTPPCTWHANSWSSCSCSCLSFIVQHARAARKSAAPSRDTST